MYFPHFTSEAKIWIYQSNKPIDAMLRDELNNKLKNFVENWAAHGNKLKAKGEIIDEYRLVICTDGNIEASGCSIDGSVRFIKELGQNYNIDFFNRLLVLVLINDEKELIQFSQLAQFPNAMMFNSAPENLGSFRSNEKMLVSDYLKK